MMKTFDENLAALTIQSYWKGYKTRSLLREVNEAFHNLCMEIDGSVSVEQNQDKIFQIFSTHSSNFEFHSKEQQETNLSDVSAIEESSSVNGDEVIHGDSEEHVVTITRINPPNESDLLKERQDIAMELLWVQQAIDSRKEYLRFKNNLSTEDARL